MKQILTILFSILITSTYSQNSNKIFTSDIDNFWVAYDSIQKTNDYAQKLNYINKLYIEKGTKGLKAFMEERNYSDTLYLKVIEKYPKFWKSVRQNTLTIKNKTAKLNKAVENLRKLYPELKDAEMYFTIGGIRSGGTTRANMILVGAEIATGNSTVETSEFRTTWLKSVFAKSSVDDIVYLNMHEYVHTQQTNENNYIVLNQCIAEGSCDFIAELTIEERLDTQYLSYGKAHARETKGLFKKEMFSENTSNWLSNGGKKAEAADLGYYIGYEICKSYYVNSKNKSQAIKDIIELNFNDNKAVEIFLNKSKFFNEKIDKNKIIEEYNKTHPSK